MFPSRRLSPQYRGEGESSVVVSLELCRPVCVKCIVVLTLMGTKEVTGMEIIFVRIFVFPSPIPCKCMQKKKKKKKKKKKN